METERLRQQNEEEEAALQQLAQEREIEHALTTDQGHEQNQVEVEAEVEAEAEVEVVVEKSTGKGKLEVAVDPSVLAAEEEYLEEMRRKKEQRLAEEAKVR